MPLLATHVGSLPRSQAVADQLFASKRCEAVDAIAFDTCMTAAVLENVLQQTGAGIEIVSDGEAAKISYVTCVKDRYTGFTGNSPRTAPADLKLVSTFLDRLAQSGDRAQYACPQGVRPVTSKGQGEPGHDIANLQAAMAAHRVARGVMNAASPGVISLFLQNAHFPTRERHLFSLADAMREEYHTILDRGLDLQHDCPDLGLSRHMLFTHLSDAEFLAAAVLNAEALRHALQAAEQMHPNVAAARHIWIIQRQPFMANMLTRIGSNDETSVKINMAQTNGWAPRDERRSIT